MDLPASYTDQFSAPDGYIDFASVGPPSRAAAAAAAEAYRLMAEPDGRVDPPLSAALQNARDAVARLVVADREGIVLIHSTSEGLFNVAYGLGEGGNVVVPATEFPANLYPWIRAAERGGPQPRFVPVPDGRVTADLLRPYVDGSTVAISVSLVDYLTGFRVNLDEMRSLAADRLLIVDGIQAVGALDVRLEPADVLVAGAQKWLRAGIGVGFMAVSSRALDRLGTSLVGWTGVEDFLMTEQPAPHAPLAGATRFQLGSGPMTLAPALGAAIDVLELATAGHIEAAVLERSRRLEEAVRRAGGLIRTPPRTMSERSGILSFRPSGGSAEAVLYDLSEAGVVASVRAREWVRVSPHATTPLDIADRVFDVLS